MRLLMTWVFICTSLLSGCGKTETLDGTWQFQHSVDYFGRTSVDLQPYRFTTLSIHNGEIHLNEDCVGKLAPERYFFSDIFQPLSKGGTTEKQLDRFLLKKLNLSLAKTTEVYKMAENPVDCAAAFYEFFVVGDRLLFPAGITFHTYVKIPGEPSWAPVGVGLPVATMIAGYKLSKLPMDDERYIEFCRPKILDAKRHPRTTDKCAPDYFPYVADPKSADPIMRIIGNHDYAKWGQEDATLFSTPFEEKVPATFMIFPPMKQVILVSVEDLDVIHNEFRERMSGVYLSIVNGRVVDQISNCIMNEDYVCMAFKDSPAAKLTDSGKFQKLN